MNKNILLIEDDEFIGFIYKRQLEKSGYHVDFFQKGQEGLAQAQNNTYDLLLLDIMLPDSNGLDILRSMKSAPTTKNTPVLLLTNLGQESVIKEAFSLGAEGYFIKASYTPDQIVNEVTMFFTQQNTSKGTPQKAAPLDTKTQLV